MDSRLKANPGENSAWWNFAEQRESWVAHPALMTDCIARKFVPQTPRAQRYYDDYRQRGYSPYNAVIAVNGDIFNSG